MLNYIIIGAGISGLYTAYHIRKKHPNAKITILEKEKIGGRMEIKKFYGATIRTGAGIGRKNDKLLLSLLRKLKIKAKKTKINSFYTFNNIDIIKYLHLLRKCFKSSKFSKQPTFKSFAQKVLKKKYKLFIQSSGYSDYENEDIKRTLYNYNMEDNNWDGTGYIIDWMQLLKKIIEVSNPIIKIEEVISFKHDNAGIVVKSNKNEYVCDKLIMATTAETLHKLLPGYEYIHGQPFLRLFAKFYHSKKLINRMKEINSNCIITDSPLQKILPIDIKKGIYMISYSDNKHALNLRPHIKNTKLNRKYFEKLFNAAIFDKDMNFDKNMDKYSLPKIKEIWGRFWNIGTHYFAPINNKVIQNPQNGVFIVGEMISDHQGWTEGALDSVEKIKKKILL